MALDPLNALQPEDVAEHLSRLTAAHGRKMVDPDGVRIWVDRLRSVGAKPKELSAVFDTLIDTAERFPSLAQALAVVYRLREASAGEESAKRRRFENENPEAYEAWRQNRKRALGLAEHRPAEHERQYGPEIQGVQAPMVFGPVLTPDGSPDPQWPEIEGRDPAWRRKALVDHGLATYRQAQSITCAATFIRSAADRFGR